MSDILLLRGFPIGRGRRGKRGVQKEGWREESIEGRCSKEMLEGQTHRRKEFKRGLERGTYRRKDFKRNAERTNP